MEFIIIWLIAAIIFYGILYFVIKAAVRNAIIEAGQINAAKAGQFNTDDFDEGFGDGNSISKVRCPNCNTSHDMDYPKCPYCKYQY